jgi:6-pyruvoyltetrahydropterin/6-carboxytetrahydropterin synthase
MITITRKIEFDAGHRVMNHESKCATLHGHRYVIEVEATAPNLDGIGRVIDFSVVKEQIGGWIDKHWDHTTLVAEEDTVTLAALKSMPQYKAPYVCAFNPTAENMAHYLLNDVCPRVLTDKNVKVSRIRVWETPNCFAEAAL